MIVSPFLLLNGRHFSCCGGNQTTPQGRTDHGNCATMVKLDVMLRILGISQKLWLAPTLLLELADGVLKKVTLVPAVAAVRGGKNAICHLVNSGFAHGHTCAQRSKACHPADGELRPLGLC